MRPLSPTGTAVTSTRFSVLRSFCKADRASSCTLRGSRNEGRGRSPTGGTSSKLRLLTSIGAMAVVAKGSSSASGPTKVEASTSGKRKKWKPRKPQKSPSRQKIRLHRLRATSSPPFAPSRCPLGRFHFANLIEALIERTFDVLLDDSVRFRKMIGAFAHRRVKSARIARALHGLIGRAGAFSPSLAPS